MTGTPGRSGRKPKPTALRILGGNAGKRPLNQDEPVLKTPTRLPPPPTELSEAAKKEWRKTGKLLLASGIFGQLDGAQFAALCQSYTVWLECQAMLSKSSLLIKNKRGDLIPNPLLRVARDAQEQFTRSLSEFGMTPSSRSRLKVPKPVEDDPFEAYMKRKATDDEDTG